MEKVTIDLILDSLKGWVEDKREIAPHIWLNSAIKLNILLSDETDNLYDLAQKVAQLKVSFIEQDKSVAEAKARVECSEEYKEMKKQEARISMIEENIRLAKIMSRSGDFQLKSPLGNYEM